MERTAGETAYLRGIRDRLLAVQSYLSEHPIPDVDMAAADWFSTLVDLKRIRGNSSNDDSFIACLLAKDYLMRTLPMQPFDVALKAQGANGLDIDALTLDGKRVVGEIKTTVPHLGTRLGAKQLETFRKDFKKLQLATAEYKYFFVTNLETKALAAGPYAADLVGVSVVLLSHTITDSV